jgi:hypothetical protein
MSGAETLNPAALSIEQAARILSATGSRPITPGMIHGDIDAGAPTNVDGTLNLVHYAAWLIGELNHAD